LVYGHLTSEEIERFGWTERDAGAAVDAQIPVDSHPSVRIESVECRLRANLEAGAASLFSNTLVDIVSQLLFRAQALGVATPLAAERTPLEKDRSPYSRPVVQAVVLNIENHALRIVSVHMPMLRFPS